MRRPVLNGHRLSAAALVAVAMMLAGCGLTDNGPQPGVAAEVEGQRLELSRVDQALDDYCGLLAKQPEAQPSPKALIRSQFAIGWSQAIAVEHLADKYAITLPPDTIDRSVVEANWGELGTIDEDNYDSFELLTWIQLRLTTPVEAIGATVLAEETGQNVSGDQATQRGAQVVQAWLDEHEFELNPVFGDYNEKTGVFDGDSLSVPVSDLAEAAADTSKVTAEQVNALPAAQRCGPAGQSADPVPAA